MKKVLLIAVILFLCGCSVPFQKSVSITDFRKYTEAGFIISPATSGFTYQPIGVISVKIIEGKQERQEKSQKVSSMYLGKNGEILSMAGYIEAYGKVAFDTEYGNNSGAAIYTGILDEMVKEAKKLGANGILNFSATRTYDATRHAYVIYASGFAVKIE